MRGRWSPPATRRLAAPASFVAAVGAVMVVHTAARAHTWRYEWRWATYQYHFGLILAGPLVAGVAAWVGSEAARGRWLTATVARPASAVRVPFAGLLAAWGAYLAAWAVPAAIVLHSGTTDRLTYSTLATFLPAFAALAAYCMGGYALGARVPGRLAAPAAAIVAFALTLGGWIAGAELLVRLGGAGTTMTGLRPNAVVASVQAAMYGAASIGFAAAAGRWLGGRTVASRLVTVGASTVALAAAAWLTVTPRGLFDHPRPRLECVTATTGQQFCAGAPYLVALEPLAAHYAPMVERLRGIGADLPAQVHLGSSPDLFEGEPSPLIDGIELDPLLGVSRCAVQMDQADRDRTIDDQVGLGVWLAHLVGDRSQLDNLQLDTRLPAALRSDDAVTLDAWATDALERVMAVCRPVR